MSVNKSIPIVFGITGHRDIRPTDTAHLRNALAAILNQFKEEYPNTEIILLSALAEGADMLAAEVAIELGIPLSEVLPYQEEAYTRSFRDPAFIERFRSIQEKASKNLVLDCKHTQDIGTCYENLGRYIANESTILIVLWDGSETGERGGTSAVFRYATSGIKENRFDQLYGNAVFTIYTPRQSNPIIDRLFETERLYFGTPDEQSFNKMLQQIDQQNAVLRDEDSITSG